MGGGGVSRCLKGINASFREILGNKVVWSTFESRIEIGPTNHRNHAYIEGRRTFFCRRSISLVSKAFNLISEAFFRKMIEVSIFIFISGL